MKFRDDIDPANTWVVSDTHFGHDNIVGFCFRPEDHEAVMIAQWRATVPDDATVLHLGDVCYGHNGGNTRFRRLTSKELTGKNKLLVRGNHDNQSHSFYRDSGFRTIRPFQIAYGELADEHVPLSCLFNGQTWLRQPHIVSFSHYPWNPDYDGVMGERHWRVHGHIHNNGYTRGGFVPFLKQHLNVSMEQTRYTPVNLKVLLDAALLGQYTRTTEDEKAEARFRRSEAMERSRTSV